MLHAEYIGPELHNLIARIVNAGVMDPRDLIVNAGAIDPRDLRATPAASAAMGLDQKTIDLYAGATIPVAATFQPPGHPGRKCRLTAERASIITEHIAKGAWDYIAAEAAGISQNQFYNYLERFPVFKRNVEAARAQARMDAEERVRNLEPSKWLRNGPGRDLPGRPGWTAKETTIIAGGANGELSGGILDWRGLDNLTEEELCTLKRLVEKAKGAPLEMKAADSREVNSKQLTPAVDPDITDAEIVPHTED